MTEDAHVLSLVVRLLYETLDALVDDCTTEHGGLKSPGKDAVLKARKMLPAEFKHTLYKTKP